MIPVFDWAKTAQTLDRAATVIGSAEKSISIFRNFGMWSDHFLVLNIKLDGLCGLVVRVLAYKSRGPG
jgi:hypothetical protein